jgi:hypothetical protein
MTRIIDLVEQIDLENKSKQVKNVNPINVSLVLDVSGSTAQVFEPKKTVLAKEVEVMTNYILSNPEYNYMLYSFDDSAKSHGKVNILKKENFVDLPNFKPGTSTNTCSALNMICGYFNNFKPDKVIIFTDGQTNNRKQDFTQIIDRFKASNTKMELFAISDLDKNLETITVTEEARIPGMDLVNMLGNSIDSLNIYNKFHKDIPYLGISNSSIDKDSITFMGFKVEGFVISYIDKLLDLMVEKKLNLEFGTNHMDLKKMLSEIGKLLSVLFVHFPLAHPFLDRIVYKVDSCLNEPFGLERMLKIMEYGFNCSKSDVPVIMTNFDQHIKESTTKHNEFSDAVTMLQKFGTGLNAQRKISIPYGKNAICVLDTGSVELTKPLGEFPNSCDKYNNIYFGIDSSEQAIRIGIRKMCEMIGFPNARNSPTVIFYVLNQMSLMYLMGVDLECEHMLLLRKIAKAQVSMEVMVSQGKYDGMGCYSYWKQGKLIPMHFSKTTTHTSLYADKMINPLELSEPIWWAVQMSMLGLFEEQKSYYSKTIEQLGINVSLIKFLEWFRKNYIGLVDGKVIIEKTIPVQKSIYTLDYFEPDEEIFELKEHDGCKTCTWYSKTEIEEYVMEGGCVWCKFKPLSIDLCPIKIENWSVKISSALKNSKPIEVKNQTVFNTFGNLNIKDPVKKYRINLIGVTGSGKSTCAEKIKNLIIQKGGVTLIVSADKWSKQNYKGKDLQNKILNEIRQFETFKSNLKVIIVDMCNENGIVKESFGFNFSTYIDINFYPNFDSKRFDQYESWCLSNVLTRPLHNSQCNYWLNHVSAGVETCIKVHNLKTKGIAKLLGVKNTLNFDEKMSITQITNLIKIKSDQYKEYLKTINLDSELENMISTNILD